MQGIRVRKIYIITLSQQKVIRSVVQLNIPYIQKLEIFIAALPKFFAKEIFLSAVIEITRYRYYISVIWSTQNRNRKKRLVVTF
jgi:hypothetical protein